MYSLKKFFFVSFFVFLCSTALVFAQRAESGKKSKYEFFKSRSSTECIALVEESSTLGSGLMITQQYYSPDGIHFYKMQSGSSIPQDGIEAAKQYFTVPGLDNKAIVWLAYYDSSKIVYEEKNFVPTKLNLNKIKLLGYPKSRGPEYLFKLNDNYFIYVSKDVYELGYDNFRVFVGPLDNMTLIPLTESPERYRDGGTTYIWTRDGLLLSPAGHKGDPTWQDKKIIRLDPRRYKISEVENKVTIIPR